MGTCQQAIRLYISGLGLSNHAKTRAGYEYCRKKTAAKKKMLVAFRDQECDSDALAMLLQSSEHHELTGAALFVGYMMPAYSIAKCLRFATSPTLPICGPMKSWHPSGDSSGSFFNFFLFHCIIQSLFKRTWQCSSIFAHLLKAGSPSQFTIYTSWGAAESASGLYTQRTPRHTSIKSHQSREHCHIQPPWAQKT